MKIQLKQNNKNNHNQYKDVHIWIKTSHADNGRVREIILKHVQCFNS